MLVTREASDDKAAALCSLEPWVSSNLSIAVRFWASRLAANAMRPASFFSAPASCILCSSLAWWHAAHACGDIYALLGTNNFSAISAGAAPSKRVIGNTAGMNSAPNAWAKLQKRPLLEMLSAKFAFDSTYSAQTWHRSLARHKCKAVEMALASL